MVKKGNIPWNKSKKGLQLAWNKGLKNWRKDYKHSDETKRKIGLSNSISLKGIIPWNKGKKGLQSAWNKGKNFIQVTGERNGNWKGGKNKLNHLIRGCDKYFKWRLDCFQRDKWICRSCKDIEELEVHHIKPVSVIIIENNLKTFSDTINCKELWDIDNGVTLCHKCHSRVDDSRKMKE